MFHIISYLEMKGSIQRFFHLHSLWEGGVDVVVDLQDDRRHCASLAR